MIDRSALKRTARQSMKGLKPSAYLVAAIYISIFTILAALIYALTGMDRFFEYLAQALPVNPYLSSETLLTALPVPRPEAVLLILLILVVRFCIDIGFLSYCLKISRSIKAEVKSLFDGFAFIFKALWLEILRLAFVFLWSLLLVVPGIVAYYSYRQAFFILLDNPELGALDCIRQSKRMMDGHKTDLFMLDLSFIGWFIVDYAVEMLATLPLFSIWLAPYVGVTRAAFYDMLKTKKTASGPE